MKHMPIVAPASIPEITLELETKTISAKYIKLPSRKELFGGRIPRRIKKQKKKELGYEGYLTWCNESIYNMLSLDEVCHIDAFSDEEIDEALLEEILTSE